MLFSEGNDAIGPHPHFHISYDDSTLIVGNRAATHGWKHMSIHFFGLSVVASSELRFESLAS